jgi:signal transduction histidine kinase
MSASDACPRQLSIGTASSETDVSVTVADSGPGVDPEDLGRIFDAFYSTKTGGLGLGLSICRAIIEAHRGTLSVASTLHRGATFRLCIPAAPKTPERLKGVRA